MQFIRKVLRPVLHKVQKRHVGVVGFQVSPGLGQVFDLYGGIRYFFPVFLRCKSFQELVLLSRVRRLQRRLVAQVRGKKRQSLIPFSYILCSCHSLCQGLRIRRIIRDAFVEHNYPVFLAQVNHRVPEPFFSFRRAACPHHERTGEPDVVVVHGPVIKSYSDRRRVPEGSACPEFLRAYQEYRVIPYPEVIVFQSKPWRFFYDCIIPYHEPVVILAVYGFPGACKI